MTNEEICKLWKKINFNYENMKFEKALELLDQYVKIEKIGINEFVLDMYVSLYINLNEVNKALKYIKLINQLYPEFYADVILAIRYIQCFKYEEAVNIIENSNITDSGYYSIAKQFMLFGQYYLSKKYFNTCIDVSNNPTLKQKSKKQLNKINRHLLEDKFIEQNYRSFKEANQILEKGHIVYVFKVDNENYSKNDPKSNVRPYMVWKVVGDLIYCFPVTTKISGKLNVDYVLYEQNYLNFDSDRRIKDNIAVIKKSKVQKVYEKLNEKDFNIVLTNIYKNIYFQEQDIIDKKRMFINDYISNMNVKINDIIAIVDKERRKKHFYFIVDEDVINKKYKVVELSRNDETKKYEIANDNYIYIKKNVMVFYSIKLSNEEIENIKREIKKNVKYELEIGDFILYNNKKLLVIDLDSESYVCIGESINSESSTIITEGIPRNGIYTLIKKLSKEELKEKRIQILTNRYSKNNKEKKI